MDEFPGNSQRRVAPKQVAAASKEDKPEKHIEKVISGEVKKRKQPLTKRMKAVFLGGDSGSVKDYLILEVLVPNIKDLIADMVTGGIERMVYGDNVRPNSRRGGRHNGSQANFNYNSISRGPIQQHRGREDPRRPVSRQAHILNDLEEIEFNNRTEAEIVLTKMFDVLDQFEAVTVSDYYEMCGHTGSFTDRQFGWTDLRGTLPRRVRGGGYILDLPQTEPLD